ncbi:MAG: phosphoribosyl-AMP cyclohydrolase [Omnitrophica bacterium RIFCSPHIGHO2_02_FULL_46_11]|nr:MAG: phosphoribosyl-AMP cyclohydrolase [Omnitrophica bacterium RIFCSPHIGHO2_02_FULL_46_11]OGW86319.1 MAG: phosphoribosyl-AMP cyclohydrolase [Omnitrophica bacterium RIFCSPLOWO2_01_FULL_45_10b]
MIKFKFDQNSLMPAIVQDYKSGEVLMLAYVNRTAIRKMLTIGKTCFYSRSRKTYWIKGETSGHIQNIKEITTDCDRDTLLIKVKQTGGACHLGYRTCFVHQLNQKWNIKRVTQKKVFDPKKIY